MTFPAELSTAPSTFTEFLERAASRGADRAVHDGAGWRSWRDCLVQSERTAQVLHRRGLRSGDVLATQLPNCWELLVLHAATARLGILLLPLHTAYRAYEVRSLVTQAGAVALVARDSYRGHPRVEEILVVRDGCPSLRTVWISSSGDLPVATTGLRGSAELVEEAPDSAGPLPPTSRDVEAPLLLLASSGTTSRRPKLCVHRHAGLLSNAATVAADGGFGAADTIVSASPLSHAFGLLSVHLALVTGGAVGLFEGWNAQNFLDLLDSASATAAFAVPAQLRDLVSLLDKSPAPGHVLPALREVRTGGAPVPRELVEGIRRTTRARVVVQWGMTEVGAGTYTRPGDPAELTATVGRPATGAEVRVVDPTGASAAPGVTGELHYRSPYMFSGYFQAPEATRDALTPDGWLRSGDLAALNADGTVSYRGRTDELINRGGLKFSALEVESLLNDLPQLAQHAIVAQPDFRLGQRSCLIVALQDGAEVSLEEVNAHLSGKGLATYKLPERLVVVDQLPTTVTGKIARARLKDIPLLAAASQPVPSEAVR